MHIIVAGMVSGFCLGVVAGIVANSPLVGGLVVIGVMAFLASIDFMGSRK